MFFAFGPVENLMKEISSRYGDSTIGQACQAEVASNYHPRSVITIRGPSSADGVSAVTVACRLSFQFHLRCFRANCQLGHRSLNSIIESNGGLRTDTEYLFLIRASRQARPAEKLASSQKGREKINSTIVTGALGMRSDSTVTPKSSASGSRTSN